jgi:predicted  nucleic acid-binding Zn-ribbon protein
MDTIIIAIISIIIIVVLLILLNRSKSDQKAYDVNISKLNNRIFEKDQAIVSSNLKSEELNKGLADRNVRIQNLENRITELEESLESAKKKITETEVINILPEKEVVVQDSKGILSIGVENQSLNAEIEKLKKQLKDAEDELEDAQDDAEDYKKRWEDQRNKLNEASERLDKCNKELYELHGAIEKKTLEIETTQNLLAKKQESIIFLNEILGAKDADSKDIKDLNDKLSKIVGVVEGDVFHCLESAGYMQKDEESLIKVQLWQWVNLQKKTWLQKNKVIAFVGEFSAGKTSIVNRILSQDNDKAPKLPVSSKATTAIATYISHGRDFHCSFTNPEGKLKNISSATFEKVNKEVLEEVNVSPLIQYFVMSYNNDNLQNLSVLDTPGFNSNDKEDAKRTADVIREADALFWVFDANTGEINKSSLSIIKENLQNLPLFIVINKADTKSPGELDKLEVHIKDTIRKNDIIVKGYIRFSKEASIDVLLNAINSVKHDNTKNEFLNDLYEKMVFAKKEIDKNYKLIKKEFESNTRKEEMCLQNLSDKGEIIYDKCEEGSQIPQFKERIKIFGFGGDHYDMSVEMYNNLIGVLQDVIDNAGEINNLNGELAQLSKNTKTSQDNLEQIKTLRNDFEKCIKNFEANLIRLNPSFIRNYQSTSSSSNVDSDFDVDYSNKDFDAYHTNNENPSNTESDLFKIRANHRLNKSESNYLSEIFNIYKDKGEFLDEDVPVLQKLAKGYRISDDRMIELANYIVDYYSKDGSNDDSEEYSEEVSVSDDIEKNGTDWSVDISNIISDNGLIRYESQYLSEIIKIYHDRGGFTDEDVPMLIKLAKGYYLTDNRAIEIANYIINYYNDNIDLSDDQKDSFSDDDYSEYCNYQ